MHQLLFARPALRRLADAATLGRTFTLALRGLAVLAALEALAASYDMWNAAYGRYGSPSFPEVVGMLVTQLLLLGLGAVAASILLVRAADVAALPPRHPAMSPIAALGLQAAGELAAVTYVTAGVGTLALHALDAAGQAGAVWGALPLLVTRGWWTGLASGLAVAVLALATAYYLAERIGLLAAIERHTAWTAGQRPALDETQSLNLE